MENSDLLLNFRIKCLCEFQNALMIEAYRKLEEYHPEISVFFTKEGDYFGEVFLYIEEPMKVFFRKKTIHPYEITLWPGYRDSNRPVREFFENLAEEMIRELVAELADYENRNDQSTEF